MRRLLLLMLLAGLAAGQDMRPDRPLGPLRFTDVYPPDCKVDVQLGSQWQYRGLANQVLQVERPDSQGSLAGRQLRFTHPGFVEQKFELQPEEFDAGQVTRPVHLQAVSLGSRVWYGVRYHPGTTASAALLLGGLTCWGLLQRRSRGQLARRQARLDELRANANPDDPLVTQQVRFGRYVVVDKLGAGGMAAVYKGLPEDTLDEAERVAIKVMHPEADQNDEYKRRFRREYQVLRDLGHPQIVRLLDGGEQSGRLYIVMEFVDGEPLSAQLQGQLPLEKVWTLVEPILNALTFAHGRSVVHRDLKPENVMVTPSGQVKLMDFGLARAEAMSRLTVSGTGMGTPRYMPPEQLTGGIVSPASDQYSLGVMLFEMLTGTCPFDGTDPWEIATRQMTTPPPRPRDLRPDLPEALEALVLRMLAKDPLQRYPDLAEVREGLAGMLREVERTR